MRVSIYQYKCVQKLANGSGKKLLNPFQEQNIWPYSAQEKLDGIPIPAGGCFPSILFDQQFTTHTFIFIWLFFNICYQAISVTIFFNVSAQSKALLMDCLIFLIAANQLTGSIRCQEFG